MIKKSEYSIIELEPWDEPFLWKMLYQAIYIAPNDPPINRDILQNPKISRYVEGWGKPDDLGYKLHFINQNFPIGAIWVRMFTQENKGYGYINDNTPELAMSINQEFRNMGFGTLLLTHLFSCLSKKKIKSVSLSVSLGNPARNLYKRNGFDDIGTEYEDSITMIKEI